MVERARLSEMVIFFVKKEKGRGLEGRECRDAIRERRQLDVLAKISPAHVLRVGGAYSS